MKIKTSELQGAALDWAVGHCKGVDMRINYVCQVIDSDDIEYEFACHADNHEHAEEQAKDAYPNADVWEIEHIGRYSPSTNREQGHEILESKHIGTRYVGPEWVAQVDDAPTPEDEHLMFGPTPLVAGLRCYVASKLGDEIDVPDSLLRATDHE